MTVAPFVNVRKSTLYATTVVKPICISRHWYLTFTWAVCVCRHCIQYYGVELALCGACKHKTYV